MEASTTYSLEECINAMGLGKFQWRLITILGFCSMADAVEMMLLAILGPALTCYWPDVTEVQIASLTTVEGDESFRHRCRLVLVVVRASSPA